MAQLYQKEKKKSKTPPCHPSDVTALMQKSKVVKKQTPEIKNRILGAVNKEIKKSNVLKYRRKSISFKKICNTK